MSDTRHLTLDEQKTLDKAWRRGAKVVQTLALSQKELPDEFARALYENRSEMYMPEQPVEDNAPTPRQRPET